MTSSASDYAATGVNQFRDHPVQRFILATHRCDLIDGVQHCRVVPAAELPADFLQRRSSDLPDDIHGQLAREDENTPVAPCL